MAPLARVASSPASSALAGSQLSSSGESVAPSTGDAAEKISECRQARRSWAPQWLAAVDIGPPGPPPSRPWDPSRASPAGRALTPRSAARGGARLPLRSAPGCVIPASAGAHTTLPRRRNREGRGQRSHARSPRPESLGFDRAGFASSPRLREHWGLGFGVWNGAGA